MTDSDETNKRRPGTGQSPKEAHGNSIQSIRSSDLLSEAIFQEFDRLRMVPSSSQAQSTRKSLLYGEAEQEFIRSLQIWSDRLQEYKVYLSLESQRDRLREFSILFTAMSIVFNRMITDKSAIFYSFVMRSQKMKADVRHVQKVTEKVAVFFENCAKKPESYRQTNGRIGIDKVITAFDTIIAFVEGFQKDRRLERNTKAISGLIDETLKQRSISAAHLRPGVPPAPPTPLVDLNASDAAMLLQRKRAAGIFDVFLCHNSDDKPTVREIGKRLKERRILPWLDEWEVPPFVTWQDELEKAISQIGSVAVFVGPSGVGPWQDIEIQTLLQEFAKRRIRMGLVWLPGALGTPDTIGVPRFITIFNWVDFRKTDPDPLEQLLWGITGQRPDDAVSS
jgi:TIR domain-containing protein